MTEQQSAVETRPTLFLDTNALIYMNSYLRMARTHSMPPLIGGMDYEQVSNKLKSLMPKQQAGYYLRGARALAYLQQEVAPISEPGAMVKASRISRAEMLYGRIDGEAHSKMAQHGLPLRARQNTRDRSQLVRWYLDGSDYQGVLQETDELFEDLSIKVGVQIEFAEDAPDARAIAYLAETLLARTFVDVLDCWIYAGAVVAQADILLSFDEDFRSVVNKLQNPAVGSEWEAVSQEFMVAVGEVYPVAVNVGLELPKGYMPTKAVPEPW